MYFEAELKKKKYEINVSRGEENWCVQMRAAGAEDWREYSVPLEHYQEADDIISFIYKQKSYLIDVVSDGLNCDVYTRGSHRTVKIYNDEMLLHESLKSGGLGGASQALSSGMPGKIVKVLVKEGDEVPEGGSLLIMEAMKMENEMKATADVTISKVHVAAGDSVESGATLISF